MKRTHIDPKTLLDRAAEAIRAEVVDPSVVDAAAERVRADLAASEPAPAPAAEHIRGCEDVQSLVPSFLAGSLSDARKLLFEDHMRECIPCRKALKAARSGERPLRPARVSKAAPRPRRTAPVRWAIAAALVAAFVAFPVVQYLLPFGGLGAVVEAAEGPVYEVASATTRELRAGDSVGSGERVRTSRDAGAVLRLDDGTRVELRERSELAVTRSGRSTTVRLDRGNVIVRAAEGGRVYVATPASLVLVDASTVAVTSGTKGTRVSAVEGTARVDSAGVERELRAGEQFASSPSISPVPVERDVAWSRDANHYAEALASLAALRKEIDAAALGGELRTSTRLLELAPADAVFFAAIPNISEGLAEANRLLEQRLRDNPALAEWWQQEHAAGNRAELDRAVGTLRELGSYLGPEIAVAASLDPAGGPGEPLVLAELTDAAGFRAALERQIAAVGGAEHVRIVNDLTSVPAGAPSQLTIWIGADLLAVSPSVDLLRHVAGGARGFVDTPFGARLADEYREGISLLVAADLERIFATSASKKGGHDAEALDRLGITGMRYFVVRQRMTGGASDARAVLTFDGQRRGIASWLAAPGPVGALEYVSPDANVVAAFVVREPAALVDDLFAFVGSADPGALESLRRFETANGVSLRDDVAASLGGEFAFAVDGPILPTPSWKVILEVNDPARLQAALEHTIEAVNRELAAAGKPAVALARTEADGRASYALSSPSAPAEMHYTYADGYLIAGPSQAILDRAVRYRESGHTILHAPRFTAALPADGQANFSAVVYHDLAPLLAQVPGSAQGAANALPTLAYAYARDDRIEFGASGDGTPFGLSPATLLGVPGNTGLQGLFERALKGN